MPHVLGLKQKDVCQRVEQAVNEGLFLVEVGAATPSAVTREGQDKRSCKQSADQLSTTHALHALSTPMGERV